MFYFNALLGEDLFYRIDAKKCQFSVKRLFFHMECMYHITFKEC